MPNMTLQEDPCPGAASPNIRNKNFKEVSQGYDEELALNEASRCLQLQEHALRFRLPRKRAHSGIHSKDRRS